MYAYVQVCTQCAFQGVKLQKNPELHKSICVFFNKNDTLYVNLLHIVIRFESKSVHCVIALGIGRATVLCNNAELVNPCKARPT